LNAVVLKDRELLHPGLLQGAEEGEGEDDGGDADAEGPTGLRADIEVGGGEDAAQEEAHECGAQGELGHVAAEDVLEPPAVFLLESPVLDLFVGKLLDGHGGRVY